MNIKELTQLATTSDQGFKELYLGTIDKLFPFVLLRSQDRDLALDICQEVYVDLWKQMSRFVYTSDEEFFGYLFLIARRKLYKHRRALREIVPLDENYDIPDSTAAPPQDYRHLLSAVAKLKDRERQVVELRYFADNSFAEIAQMLGIAEGNAKVIHHRAIAHLQTCVAQQYG